MLYAADPRDCALHTQAEAAVHDGSVLTQIQIPLVRLTRQFMPIDGGQQLLRVAHALTPAGDLTVAIRRQQVHAAADFIATGFWLHIECLHL